MYLPIPFALLSARNVDQTSGYQSFPVFLFELWRSKKLKSDEDIEISKDKAFRLYHKYKPKVDSQLEIMDDETKLLDDKIKEAEKNVELARPNPMFTMHFTSTFLARLIEHLLHGLQTRNIDRNMLTIYGQESKPMPWKNMQDESSPERS